MQAAIKPATRMYREDPRLAGIGLNRFLRWVRAGIIPSVRDGGRVFIASQAVDRLVEAIGRGEWPEGR